MEYFILTVFCLIVLYLIISKCKEKSRLKKCKGADNKFYYDPNKSYSLKLTSPPQKINPIPINNNIPKEKTKNEEQKIKYSCTVEPNTAEKKGTPENAPGQASTKNLYEMYTRIAEAGGFTRESFIKFHKDNGLPLSDKDLNSIYFPAQNQEILEWSSYDPDYDLPIDCDDDPPIEHNFINPFEVQNENIANLALNAQNHRKILYEDDLRNVTISEEFNFAFEHIEYTSNNIFVIGKAGTGKSTFLKYLLTETRKNAVALTYTGVAALNIHGTQYIVFLNSHHMP